MTTSGARSLCGLAWIRARTVFDVGANIGLYTLLAAARLQGRGAIHAFEPNNKVFAWLTRNAERNRLDNAHLSQIALSNLDGQASFFSEQPGLDQWVAY